MAGKYVSVGELKLVGKAVKIRIGVDEDGVDSFFCFLQDVKQLLDGRFIFVRIYKDNL